MAFKHRSYIALAIATQLLASSCTVNKMSQHDEHKPLVFDVAVVPNTKTDRICDQLYPEDVPFGIWAYDEVDESFLDNSKVTNMSSGKWVSEDAEVWPDSALDFQAYSPYGRAFSSCQEGIVFRDYDIDENLDLMYTTPIVGVSENNSQGVVPVQFNRALSLVRFRVRANVPEYCNIRLKEIFIDSVKAQGDFCSLPSPRWEAKEELRKFKFFDGEVMLSEIAVPVGQELYMIPQSSSVKIGVLCDIITGEIILADQTLQSNAEIIWHPGKIEAYELKIDARLKLSIEHDNS